MGELWIVWDWAKSILATAMLAGLGVTAVVGTTYAFFKFLGEKWISQKFSERLEAYKADQTRELEKLKHRINGVFDRTKRLHDKEFEVLPEIWGKLVDARGWALSYTSIFKSYADISRLTSSDLEEFLSTTRFSESQKREIKSAYRPQDAYIAITERYLHADTMDKIREAGIALSKHGIFVLPEIRHDMAKMLEFIHSAVAEHQINEENDVRPRMREALQKLKEEGEPLFKKIELAVTDRLWESTTTTI